MTVAVTDSTIELGGVQFRISRPHVFGLVIDGPVESPDCGERSHQSGDYLHEVLLASDNRDAFIRLIENERLVVCRNVRTEAPTYRKVRGKSSGAKLSQAEYYHHDGCSCPTKPRVVEIRFPHQDISREVATAIAPFPDVMRAMLLALPNHLAHCDEFKGYREAFADSKAERPPVESWDKIQGRITRLVRRELDAESCRAYFRTVDEIANAFVHPWQMGESRLMLNSHDDLTKTMQHRRAYQKPRAALEQNGSLVKRWTAEEA